ncbi:unnamed protein product [Bursaphelenchus xylophilus]|uniref:(pine wood nematode) hypothetical protein n=1 Tax=Bursaphelenchus xylophilus TaxID=6326 RepID=A0A1I7RNW6_BURXY|nr:unnamed protein product [Bursaphelenchus xylophilus]CAG9124346.1 unnamed protein product [Bursaphelenchus xylophilus]
MNHEIRNVILGITTLFVVVFPTVLLTISNHHQESLHRGVRSLFRSPEYSKTPEYLPKLRRKGSEWRFEIGNDSFGGCDQIPENLNEFRLGEGYYKRVYEYGNVAIKKSLRDGQGMTECLNNHGDTDRCWKRQIAGFQNEIGLLLQLQGDQNIPKVYAYCIPVDTSKDIFVVMEKARPLNLIVYADTPWKKRVRIASNVVDFLIRVQPFEPLDFRIDQFLLRKDDQPLFTDLDSFVISPEYDELSLATKFYGQFINGVMKSSLKSRNTIISNLHHHFLNRSLSLPLIQTSLQRLLKA